jgi:hypothetical protein
MNDSKVPRAASLAMKSKGRGFRIKQVNRAVATLPLVLNSTSQEFIYLHLSLYFFGECLSFSYTIVLFQSRRQL